MKSMPASSAISASSWQLSQSAGQRSGSRVMARPFEQFAPNKPSFSLLLLYMATRSCRLAMADSGYPVLLVLFGDDSRGLGDVAPILELRVHPLPHFIRRCPFHIDAE